MGSLLIRGKTYNGVVALKSTMSPAFADQYCQTLTLKFENGQVQDVILKHSVNTPSIRFELFGTMQYLNVQNTGYVFGNVGSAKVGNCLSVEGCVMNYQCTRGIRVNSMFNCQRNFDENLLRLKSQGRAKVIRLENIPYADISTIAISTLVVCRGTVGEFICDNCAYIKGDVSLATVDNVLEATMSYKPTRSQSRRTAEQARGYQGIGSMFSDIFGSHVES